MEQEENSVSNDLVFSSEVESSDSADAQPENIAQAAQTTPDEVAVAAPDADTTPEQLAPAELEITDTAQDQPLVPSATAEELSRQ